MTAEQLVVGNKYVPFQKTVGDDFNDCAFITESLPYLYYKGYKFNVGKHVFSRSMDTSGDYYMPEDVYTYIESINYIERGNTVVITDNGHTYSTFESAFEKLNFRNKRINDPWNEGSKGKVFGMMYNSEGKVMLALRDDDCRECLIEVRGVELIATPIKPWFELPAKWAVEVTEESKHELGNWRLHGVLTSNHGYCLCSSQITKGYWVRDLHEHLDYTVITYEQFKQYVLNQTPTDVPQEESFVLPEKWAIMIAPHNVDMLSDWRGFRILSEDVGWYMLCDIPHGRDAAVNRGYVCCDLLSGYKEITTQQFKQYVLNQTPTDMPTQTETPQTETKQYPKTPEGLYDMTLDILNLEVGDIVKVTHKVPDNYMGWTNSWTLIMDEAIGNEYEVKSVRENRNGIFLSLNGRHQSFPPYSLEFVRKGRPELNFHISETIGRLKHGPNETVKFDQPVTELTDSDIYWLAKLFVEQNRKDDIRIERL
jgi:hypothetical protein